MKKMIVLAVVTANLLAVSATSYAAAPKKIFVEDKQIQSDVAPIIEKGRVMIPIRAMTDSLDASVSWNQASKTAIIRKWSEAVKLTVGKNTAYYEKAGQVNQMTLDVPVKIINNRIYVPLRFLSQFFGYQVAANGEAVFVHSPLSQHEQEILYRGDLAEAREMAMEKGPKSAHFAHKPIRSTKEIEGFETTFLFPVGEANRFFLISDNTVSFYELQDDFFVITWQAHIPVGKKDTLELFLENKITNTMGNKPKIEGFFFHRTSGHMTSTNIAAGKIARDGTIITMGIKRIVGGEVTEESGSLALQLSGEVRLDAVLSTPKIIGGTEIKSVTKEQLKKVTSRMTYEEVVGILGHGKDIGSGLFIIEYEYGGQQFTLNFTSYDGLITEEDYKEIQKLIAV